MDRIEAVFDVGCRFQRAGLQDYLQVMLLAGGFQLLYLIAHGFIVAAQELSYGDYDVYLIRAFHDCHGGFGYFYFYESL